jgi:hypothetical protein
MEHLGARDLPLAHLVHTDLGRVETLAPLGIERSVAEQRDDASVVGLGRGWFTAVGKRNLPRDRLRNRAIILI